MIMPAVLLEVRQLEVVYHKVATAIQGVSVEVPEGKIVAVVGTNGAGKTTTLRAISGFLPAEDTAITDGSIIYGGERINGRLPHETARLGLVLVPEREKVFETLTVAENIAYPVARKTVVAMDDVYAYFPQLAERRGQLAGYLSGGEKQMLAIAMALLCGPRILLVDELSLGLAPVAIQALMEVIQRINRELGLTILLVEQNAMAALAISDYGYVMEGGRVVFKGTSDELRNHPDVQEFYLGGRGSELKSYRAVKQYRRRRRWWS
jgi:branched-chain amino acid transport system ATP-binding protein